MNNNSSKQVLLSVIGVAILVVAVVGVSFAFFNYSRTGTEVNGLTVGTINFVANVKGVQLDNAFPVSATYAAGVTAAAEGEEADEDVAVVTVTISGNTTYANGIDFSVTAVPSAENDLAANLLTSQVTFSGLDAVTNKQTATTLQGTGNTTLVSGRIPANTSVNGTITIKLYVDSANVLITDTASDPGTAAIINGRTVVTTGAWNAKSFSFNINVVATQGAAPATGA